MKRTALIATIAALLGAAATAGAASLGAYTLFNGDTASLFDTSVGCVVTSGQYGAVLVCSKHGQPAWVWIGRNEILVTKGSTATTLQPLAAFNWQGGPITSVTGTPSTTSTSSSSTWTTATLTSGIQSQYGAKLASANPQQTIKTLTCQVNVGDQGGTCVATIYANSTPDNIITVNVTATFGTGGTVIWQASPVGCQNDVTGTSC